MSFLTTQTGLGWRQSVIYSRRKRK